MTDLHDLSRDALTAELDYRREQLTGNTFPGRRRIRRARQRRLGQRAA